MRKYIKYMIHTCVDREEYVRNILAPSLVEQGIKKSDIHVWVDKERVGNLASWVASCKWIVETQKPESSIWHLQDDVIPSKRFKEVTERDFRGIANGFCSERFEGARTNYIGDTTVSGSWFSHPCKRIPNEIIARFVEWYDSGEPELLFPEYVSSGKCDDSLFRQYMIAHEPNVPVVNLFPNIVDHIDFLIGGTIINKQRKGERRQAYWRDDALNEAVEELKQYIADHRKTDG